MQLLFAEFTAFLSLLGLAQAVPQVVATTTFQAPSPSVTEAVYTGTFACNNSPLLCNRNYNNITHMGAHNSPFLRDSSTGFSTSGNQYFNATTALSAGIRLLQGQVHNENGILKLCHSSCFLLDAGTLESYLLDIKIWMDANPNEVVTILLVNSDNESAASFGSVFSSSGISKYGYIPSVTTGPVATWPTLQTLISANTRLITFIASITYDSTFPYLLSEFDYVFETAFGVTSLNEFNCTLSRPSSLTSASSAMSSGYLGLINHSKNINQGLGIVVPDAANLNITNSPSTNTIGALGFGGVQCDREWGTKPTFILVDFWNVGPTIATADNLNGIVATGRRSVSTDDLMVSSDGPRYQGIASLEKMVGLALVVALVNWV